MENTTININHHKYLCKKYKYNEYNTISKKFVMLKNFSIANNITYETDLYFIDKDIYESNANLIYPISNENERFSYNINDFQQIAANSTSYILYDEKFKEKYIKCDKIRVYHPFNKTDNSDILIYVDTYINGIHIHLFCCLYDEIYTNSETIEKVGNESYTEFVEFYIPNIVELFNKTTYYIEDFNICKVDLDENKDLILHKENQDFVSLYLYNVPFTNQFNNKIFITSALEESNTNIYNIPIRLLIYPFSNVYDNQFIEDENNLPGNKIFIDKFETLTKICYDRNNNGKFIVKQFFEFNDIFKGMSLLQAYQKSNNINFKDYKNIYYESSDEGYNETSSHIQYQCVYYLEISDNPNFSNILWKSNIIENVTLLNYVKEIYYEIDIFNNWNELPEKIYLQATFIDRYLGTIIKSNILILDDENLKFIIKKQDKLYKINFNNMADNKLFPNNIKCNIKIESNDNKNSVTIQNNKIVFKPIFFKTYDLQNIYLHNGVVENIGVDLSDYMTKVETFYIIINNTKFIESSRNGIYVIFKIDTNKINGKSGKYLITDQDNLFISSGDWQSV